MATTDTVGIVLIAALVVVGFATAVAAGSLVIYRRLRSRPCPTCGAPVSLERFDCRECGADLRAITPPDLAEPAGADEDDAPPSGIDGLVCAFCGEEIGEREPAMVSGRWWEEGEHREQWWAAHRACLAERLEAAREYGGPLFGDTRAPAASFGR